MTFIWTRYLSKSIFIRVQLPVVRHLCQIWSVFSSPGRSPGRAIALPPVSASAPTFTLKFFKSSYFPNHMMDLVHIWYDNRYRSKVSFRNTPTHAHDLTVKFTDFEILQIKYYVIVFKELVFSKPNDGFGSYFAWWQIEVQSLISPCTTKWRGNIGFFLRKYVCRYVHMFTFCHRSSAYIYQWILI